VDQPNILPVPASHVQKLGFARESGGVRTRATRAVARSVSVRNAPVPAHLSAHFAPARRVASDAGQTAFAPHI
jgi:hypothetical protein